MKITFLIPDDPLFWTPLAKDTYNLIKDRHQISIALVAGDFATTPNQSKWKYFLTLMIILGPIHFPILVWKRLLYMVCKGFFQDKNPLSIVAFARANKIPLVTTCNLRDPSFLRALEEQAPDIMVCQINRILGPKLLSIPRIACINRHGGLLPRYRGRLAPFWSLLHGEPLSGVSIHIIDTKIDNGPIVVQKEFSLNRFDTLNTVVKKIFLLSPYALAEAIDILSAPDYEQRLISNSAADSTYFSSPTLKDAFRYWWTLSRRFLCGQ